MEFHKAKTILMKLLAYSLINIFFSKRRRLFTEVLFRARWFFTSAHKRLEVGRGNEIIPFFFGGLRLHTRVPKTLDI